MSSTPVTPRRQPIRRQVAVQSTRQLNREVISNECTDDSSDPEAGSGYSTPVGETPPCVSPSKVLSRLSTPKYGRFPGRSVPGVGAGNAKRDLTLPCDVTCEKKDDSGICACSSRWQDAANSARDFASNPVSRRAAYERAELAAGREPNPKISGLLEREQPLYPNCDLAIWLRSCDVETTAPIRGDVSGQVPPWLRGSLLRNGPGNLGFGGGEFGHLFDGSALVQRYALADGTATYQNRFLRTDTFQRNSGAGRIVVSEYGTRGCPEPCRTIFNRVAAIFYPGEALSDNAMISVYPFGDEFYAFTESTIVTRFDPVTLDTIERVNLADHVGIINHSAHPIIFPDCAISLGMALGATGPRYSLVQFPIDSSKCRDGSNATKYSKTKSPQEKGGRSSTGNSNCSRAFSGGRIVANVPARWPLHPSYMHTFGLTESFFVLVEQPMAVSMTKILHSQLDGDCTGSAMRWFPEYPTRLHLIDRASGHLTHTFCTATLFYLHIINAFECDNVVFIDICCYENPEMINCMYIDSLRTGQTNPNFARMFRGRPLRFAMPLKGDIAAAAAAAATQPAADRNAATICRATTFIKPEQLSDLGCETPRVPDNRIGKKYRYFYAISSDVDLENPGTLIKVDTERKRSWRWAEDGVYPSEPIFVSRPSSQAEDDGVILSALTWSCDERRTAVLILDAPTWTEVGRVEFKTPSSVPKCLHGWFAQNVV